MSENNRDEDRKNANSLFIQRFSAIASSDLEVPISCRQGWGSVLSTGGGGLANGPLRSQLAGGSGAILPIYRISCQEFGESHFRSSCQIPYTVQKFSLFPKPHSISVNSRYPIILLQTLLNVYTAISRKVVGKNVHAEIPKGNLGYDQYAVSDTVAVKPTFVAFL